MLYINPETKDNKRKIIVRYNNLMVIFSLSYSEGNMEINFIFFLSINLRFFSSKNTEIEVKTENVRREYESSEEIICNSNKLLLNNKLLE
tara:strand:+ start:370 stop:639 length:270 start_codon:yes stop_codon:yes gene_type:complete